MGSLTSKYRPQRFGDVAGQEAVKRILSKASAEDKIAPAYLFSGTRGVGKTTLARVLAKALNCVAAPAAEPCNECHQCKQITAGISPDVIEIDAATHGTVDEARRLKEDIGYAPLQSRYKVFIIDEAHMLSKAAFNALLKTLEEPPGRVTFILATTEPHKILPTIISRCQHYVFKRLTQPELEAHLAGLLTREGNRFEPQAVSLIARRGAGSVRDSMSLLAQVLAMGGEVLREQDVRDVLGLAGQDVFFSFMQCFKDQDCLGVSGLLRGVLDRGLDIGFFLRELAACWRDMFLLNQAGENALANLELTEEEGRQWLAWATQFEARHIHACWQMTLEGQRRVMTSLEPALALELLLLNLAYIPKLLTLEAMAARQGGPAGTVRAVAAARGQSGQGPAPAARPMPAGAPAPGAYPRSTPPYGAPMSGGPATPAYGAPAPGEPAPQPYGVPMPGGQSAAPDGAPSPGGPATTPYGAPPSGAPRVSAFPAPGGLTPGGPVSTAQGEPSPVANPSPAGGFAAPARADLTLAQPSGSDAPPPVSSPDAPLHQPTYAAPASGEPAPAASPSAAAVGAASPPPRQPLGPPTWKGFKNHAKHELKGVNPLLRVALSQLDGAYEVDATGGVLTFKCNDFQASQFRDHNGNLKSLQSLANAYFACPVRLEFDVEAAKAQLSPQELRAKAEQMPLFKEARDEMGAYIIDVRVKN